MFAILKNNICVGLQNWPFNEAELAKDERQVEVVDMEAPAILLGQTYRDGRFVATEKNAVATQNETNAANRLFLKETDWQVTRHRDQLDLGVATSLTDAEYQALLQARQQARTAVVPTDQLG